MHSLNTYHCLPVLFSVCHSLLALLPPHFIPSHWCPALDLVSLLWLPQSLFFIPGLPAYVFWLWTWILVATQNHSTQIHSTLVLEAQLYRVPQPLLRLGGHVGNTSPGECEWRDVSPFLACPINTSSTCSSLNFSPFGWVTWAPLLVGFLEWLSSHPHLSCLCHHVRKKWNFLLQSIWW